MNQEVIKEFLISNRVFSNGTIVIGKIKPSIEVFNCGLGNVMNVHKNHCIGISDEGISIIPVNDISGKLLYKEWIHLERKKIISERIEMKLINYSLLISSTDGEIVYGIKRNILGAKWHKLNLSLLLLKVKS